MKHTHFTGRVVAMALFTAVSTTAFLSNCSASKSVGAGQDDVTPAPTTVHRTATATPMTPTDHIRLNQLGYYPNTPKFAVVIAASNISAAADADDDAAGLADDGDGTPPYTTRNQRVTEAAHEESARVAALVAAHDEFVIVSMINGERGEVVYRGTLSDPVEWQLSGERGRRADFSELTALGTYALVLGNDPHGNIASHPFEISDRLYGEVATASLRTYYFQRNSHELTPELAGVWARPAGHPDTAVTYHESTGRDQSETLNSPGGWYDAGDFGKYVVNSGITVGTLMAFYEMFPDYFPDGSLRIPESGNGVPDILDEIKINLDWMRTMQDEDGGVYHKLTTLTFPGYIMPHDDDGERFAIGKGTAAALNFAATMAMAGRIYMPFDSAFAQSSIEAAIRAWEWARANPYTPFKNPDDVKTGEYGDRIFDDEFVWAAAELFITTRDPQFSEALYAMDLMYNMEPTWQNVHGLAPLSLATVANDLDAQTINVIRASIADAANRWIAQMDEHLYRIPQTNFVWGSNSNFANMGVALIYAFKLTGEEKYLHAAAETADYLLGKNAVGISFMTAFGTRFAANPHHRQIVAQTGIMNMPLRLQLSRQMIDTLGGGEGGPIADEVVIPGFLVGGPNAGHQDTAHGMWYRYTLPAKSYEDNYKSYASNEVAINWNSPATFLFGALDAILGVPVAKDDMLGQGGGGVIVDPDISEADALDVVNDVDVAEE